MRAAGWMEKKSAPPYGTSSLKEWAPTWGGTDSRQGDERGFDLWRLIAQRFKHTSRAMVNQQLAVFQAPRGRSSMVALEDRLTEWDRLETELNKSGEYPSESCKASALMEMIPAKIADVMGMMPHLQSYTSMRAYIDSEIVREHEKPNMKKLIGTGGRMYIDKVVDKPEDIAAWRTSGGHKGGKPKGNGQGRRED